MKSEFYITIKNPNSRSVYFTPSLVTTKYKSEQFGSKTIINFSFLIFRLLIKL